MIMGFLSLIFTLLFVTLMLAFALVLLTSPIWLLAILIRFVIGGRKTKYREIEVK